MNADSISVVLATYNGSRYIQEQLASIFRQTRLPNQIIVSDDQSSDSTLDIVRAMAHDAPVPIVIIENEKRLGFGDNFLHAARTATSRYIAFCDQDDIWKETKISRCLDAFAHSNEVTLVVHQANLIDKGGKHIGSFLQNIESTRTREPLTLDPWGTYWGFSMVFRRDLLTVIQPSARFINYIEPGHTRSLVAHDRWVTFLAQIFGSIAEIAEPLADYRQHQSNLFGAKHHPQTIGLLKRSLTYVEATEQMYTIISAIQARHKLVFPLFDKDKALVFIEAALHQLKQRHKIYVANNSIASAAQIISSVLRGDYNGVHNGKLRLRSIARDLRYVLQHD